MLHVKPAISIKHREFKFNIPEEEYETPEKPRVRFLQEVKRVHLA